LLKVARYIFGLTFGGLAVILGLGIIGWVCYNEFIERLPQYGGSHWWSRSDRIGACHYRMVLAEQSCPKRVTDEAKA
jgi:hypothetical protein